MRCNGWLSFWVFYTDRNHIQIKLNQSSRKVLEAVVDKEVDEEVDKEMDEQVDKEVDEQVDKEVDEEVDWIRRWRKKWRRGRPDPPSGYFMPTAATSR